MLALEPGQDAHRQLRSNTAATERHAVIDVRSCGVIGSAGHPNELVFWKLPTDSGCSGLLAPGLGEDMPRAARPLDIAGGPGGKVPQEGAASRSRRAIIDGTQARSPGPDERQPDAPPGLPLLRGAGTRRCIKSTPNTSIPDSHRTTGDLNTAQKGQGRQMRQMEAAVAALQEKGSVLPTPVPLQQAGRRDGMRLGQKATIDRTKLIAYNAGKRLLQRLAVQYPSPHDFRLPYGAFSACRAAGKWSAACSWGTPLRIRGLLARPLALAAP